MSHFIMTTISSPLLRKKHISRSDTVESSEKQVRYARLRVIDWNILMLCMLCDIIIDAYIPEFSIKIVFLWADKKKE